MMLPVEENLFKFAKAKCNIQLAHRGTEEHSNKLKRADRSKADIHISLTQQCSGDAAAQLHFTADLASQPCRSRMVRAGVHHVTTRVVQLLQSRAVETRT